MVLSAPASDYSRSPHFEEDNDRDEVKEIEKLSKSETRRVQTLRIAVTALLLVAGVAVTFTTYSLLVREQERNFDDAFDQFSATVANALIESQKQARSGMKVLADMTSSNARLMNVTWPYYYFQDNSRFFKEQVESSGMEGYLLLQLIPGEDAQEFFRFKFEDTTCQEDLLKDHLDFFGSDEYYIRAEESPEDIEISGFHEDGTYGPIEDADFHVVIQYRYPPLASCGTPLSYFDVYSEAEYGPLFDAAFKLGNETVFTSVREYIPGFPVDEVIHEYAHSQIPNQPPISHPHSFPVYPILEDMNDLSSAPLGVIIGNMAWDGSLRFLIPDGVVGLIVVGRNTCVGKDEHQQFTYRIDGPDAFFLGHGDKHSSVYDDKARFVNVDFHTHPDYATTPNHCYYSFNVYPSDSFKDMYITNSPKLFAGAVAVAFSLMIVTFFLYDWFVRRRNQKLVFNAAKSSEVLNGMFPEVLRDKILDQTKVSAKQSGGKLQDASMQLRALSSGDDLDVIESSTAVAELYLNTTVMFADISGFTAWSSVREPTHVFQLLESVYCTFDRIARANKVFKVETVGDCYVAVTGFPGKQDDHAIRMCKFARSCLSKFDNLVKRLEVRLGPDTGDLGLRIGIHSGQVTAGVLRGDRARFQLFGDTVNVTSRIESTGEQGRIHLSQQTADLLVKAGKQDWLESRSDVVLAKGKGSIETFWLRSGRKRSQAASETMSDVSSSAAEDQQLVQSHVRLVEWNVQKLLELLKKVVARKNAMKKGKNTRTAVEVKTIPALELGCSFLDEVQEVIELPDFDKRQEEENPEAVHIDDIVVGELRNFVSIIAEMYNQNPFHNFEHASHVTMSVMKLLARIIAPSDFDIIGRKTTGSVRDMAGSTLHDHTYGITSDPLTQFACAFSALIHDCDHRGVPNARLIEEMPAMATRYQGRSVAEQNSLELAWNLLMDKQFVNLRAALFANESDLLRFRQLVVNGVMATDIVDKDLKQLRNGRWDKAFSQNEEAMDAKKKNRKATIVIEHLIQASDVAHTMQHWHVYRKWNERLFLEMYAAFRSGRSEKNPADFWSKGEIGFFDFYIIPLAKKLKECGVFGISSDEYLNYAMANREEWENRGPEIVAEMIEKFENRNYVSDF